jgi:hypothetical protein
MKYLAITIYIMITSFIGILGYVIGLGERTEWNITTAMNNRWPDIDAAANFKNEQVLYPDGIHKDTLIVYDAEYINKCLSDGRLKTDGDIMEILNETTVKYTSNKYLSKNVEIGNGVPVLPMPGQNYPMAPPEPAIVIVGLITKQETDERGLTSVQYVKDGQEWGLDYLTKSEYDSAFSNYKNYKP